MRVDKSLGFWFGVFVGLGFFLVLLLVLRLKLEEIVGELCCFGLVIYVRGLRLRRGLVVFEENKLEVDVLGGKVLRSINVERDSRL